MTSSNRVVGVALLLALFGAGPNRVLAQDAADQLHDISEVKKIGQLPVGINLKEVAPEYPPGMVRAGLIGSVTIEFIIDRQGAVRNPYVVRSNNPWFERPALNAVLKWKFKPGEINGKPVNVRAMQEIRFNINVGGRDAWNINKGSGSEKLPPELQWEQPPVPTNTGFPVYPFTQLRDGIGGKAEINFLIGTDGRVIGSKLLSATKPEFGLAVMAMIDGWQFQPAKHKDGTPSLALLHSAYEFDPDGGDDVPVSDGAKDVLYELKHRPERIAGLGELDTPPKLLSRRPPIYPTALEKAGEAGSVLIEFYIDKNGDAQLPRIVSSTAPEFGYAAVQAVATWRFEVPRRKGKPVNVRARIPIDFTVRERRPAEPRK